MSKRLSKKNARIIRSGIETARSKDGMHQVAMIYGMGHVDLWLEAYGREQSAQKRRADLAKRLRELDARFARAKRQAHV